MDRSRGNALTILLVALALVAAAEGFLLLRLARRVGEIEERLAPGPSASAATPLALGQEVRALEREIGDAAGRAAHAEELAARATARLDEVERTAEDLRQRVLTGGGPAGGTIPKGALEEAVAKAVEEKVRELPQGGEWKPTLEQFRETLGLSETQADSCEQVFDDAKHEAMKLLTLPRPEGGCVLDDLVAALKDPQDAEAAAKKVFLGLFTAKIPGRDEPYIAEILRIKERAQQGLGNILDAEQRKRLSRMNLDHLGVQTSYDPFGEYVRDSMR
ncbi:MAG: hypothetical protein MUE73_03865 [Planctomycetes bacterium]|jgi:hypothetical protein|nr:hypothetical protein [Planctomycetota bacterium]